MIAAPEGENQLHFDVLARLSTLLMDESFKNKLLSAKTADEFLQIIDDGEREKYPNEYDAPIYHSDDKALRKAMSKMQRAFTGI